MMEGKCSEAWDHTAAQMVLHANIHRNKKRQKQFTLYNFHPYLKKVPKRKGGGVSRDRWIAAVLSNGHRKR